MVKEIVKNILERRHFWRFASFSEVADLYMVRIMRTIGINVGAVFMSVYMLQNGFSVVQVSLFWAAYFGLKAILSLPMAQIIANIGAKKAIVISNILYIPAMIVFIFLPQIGIWALAATCLFQVLSTSLYDIGYLVNFSRVKSVEKAGSQVAAMNITEKVAKAISPLIGGLVAMFFDPRISMAISAIFFVFASWPMIRVPDSMQKGFRLVPKDFPWKLARRSLCIEFPMGFDSYSSSSAWSIFLVCLVFTASSNQVYGQVGAVTSLVLIVSILSTHLYGKLIDERHGGRLLFVSAIGNIAIHLLRVVSRTPLAAVGTNAANEVVSTGYAMAVMRGVFDVADQSGYRVFYIAMTQVAANIGNTISALILAGTIAVAGLSEGFTLFYIITAAVVSLIALSKFRIYKTA